MSLVDVFGKEDRTEVKFSEFFALVKQAAQYETLMNAVTVNEQLQHDLNQNKRR